MFSSRGTVRYEERGQGYRDVEKVGKHCSTGNAAVPRLSVTSRTEFPGGTSDCSLSARARKKNTLYINFINEVFFDSFYGSVTKSFKIFFASEVLFFLFLSCYRKGNTAEAGSKFSVYFYFDSLLTSQCSCLKKEAVWGFRIVGTNRQIIVHSDRLSDLSNVQQKYFCVTFWRITMKYANVRVINTLNSVFHSRTWSNIIVAERYTCKNGLYVECRVQILSQQGL